MSESSREKVSERTSLKREVRKEIHSADAHLENLISKRRKAKSSKARNRTAEGSGDASGGRTVK